MSIPAILASLLAQLLLLPLWLVSLYPNIFHYNIHRPLLKTDKMFTNTYRFIIPVVLGVPFFMLATVLVCGLAWGWWWQSFLWMLLATYPLARFALWDWRWMKRTARQLKMRCMAARVAALKEKRKKLFEQIKSSI